MDELIVQNAQGVMGLGNDSVPVSTDKEEPKKRRAYGSFIVWMQGFLFSLIPILAYPLYVKFTGKNSDVSPFMLAFSSSEVVFLAISLCVSSRNDSDEIHRWKLYPVWKSGIDVLIVLAAVIFGMLSIVENIGETIDKVFAFYFNIILLVVTLLAGSIPYVVMIVNVHKLRKEGNK